jgi:hypothetical protein
MNDTCSSKPTTAGGRQPKSLLAVLVAASAMAVCPWASGATISVNWKEFAGAVNDPIEPYGVVAASNWQNLQQVTNGTDLPTSDGAASTVDFSATAPGGFRTFNFNTLNDTPMRAGFAVFAEPQAITLNELSGTFSSYDVIVYVTGFNAANNAGSVSDGSTTYYFSVPNPYTASLIQSSDTDSSDGSDLGTYVRFNGLTSDSLTITTASTTASVGIGGLQITGTVIPEPTAAILLGVGLIPWAARRRQACANRFAAR